MPVLKGTSIFVKTIIFQVFTVSMTVEVKSQRKPKCHLSHCLNHRDMYKRRQGKHNVRDAK